ncbi:MAG: lysostaphin resistance A-like protein [Candidatus Kapaibacterium sp.]
MTDQSMDVPDRARFPHALFGSLSTVIVVLAFYLVGTAAQKLLGITADQPSFIFLQAAAQLVGMMLPAALLMRRSPLGVRGLLRRSGLSWNVHRVALLAGIALLTFMCESAVHELQLALLPQGVIEWMNQMSGMHDETMRALLRADYVWSIPAQVLCLAVIPAIAEEMLFRGLLQRSLEEVWRPLPAALCTTVVFALLHFQPSMFLPMVVLSAVLSMLAQRAQSLVPGIIMHAVFNASMVGMYHAGVADFAGIATNVPVWISLIMALLSAGILRIALQRIARVGE